MRRDVFNGAANREAIETLPVAAGEARRSRTRIIRGTADAGATQASRLGFEVQHLTDRAAPQNRFRRRAP